MKKKIIYIGAVVVIFVLACSVLFNFNRKTKKELIQRLIANLEITRDKNYNIKIKNIKFTLFTPQV